MTEQELAGMIWGIKEIIRGVLDEKVKKADKELFEKIAKISFPDNKLSDDELFEILRDKVSKKFNQAQVKTIRSLGEVDQEAPIVWVEPGNRYGNRVIDTNLNDTETIPMKQDINEYMKKEVLPFVPDAWRDPDKDKVGCEFPLTRLFYRYTSLRNTEEILSELMALENDTTSALQNLINEMK